MATGNVGRNLSQKSDVFLSADAGLSWHQVKKETNVARNH